MIRALERIGETIFLKDGRVRPTLRVLIFIIAALIATALVAVPLFAALGIHYNANFGTLPSFEVEAAGEWATAIAVVGVALFLRHVLDRRSLASLGLAFQRGWFALFALGSLFGAAMQCFVFAIEAALGYSHVTSI